jgi:hypothetical protein
MQERMPRRRPGRGASAVVLATAALLTGAVLSGCSTMENTLTVFADPGKYEYYSCQQLADARKALVMREQELKLLMDKAEQGAGGVVVSALAYKADHVAANEELKLVELAGRSKNCENPANWRSNSAIR